jgi:hypothetical protein
MKFTKNIGMLLLAAFLILSGLQLVFQLTFNHIGTVEGILAIAAGACILIGK